MNYYKLFAGATLLTLTLIVLPILMSGCNLIGNDKKIGDYVAASSFTKGGFVDNNQTKLTIVGKEIKVWGFVDYSNVCPIGMDDGPTPTTWQFSLKARSSSAAGSSFAIHTPKDARQQKLLQEFSRNEAAGLPTKVFVKGIARTSDLNTNTGRLIGLTIETASTEDILFEDEIVEENRQ